LPAATQTSRSKEGSSSLVIRKNEISDNEKRVNYYFKVSSATLGLTAELAQANEEIKALNESLKTENLRMSAELKQVFALFLKHGG
jgi:hypothetical protein